MGLRHRAGWRGIAGVAAGLLLTATAGTVHPPAARAAAPSWHVHELGGPADPQRTMPVGAVSVQFNASDKQRPYMFNVIDQDLQVTWWTGGMWAWTNLHSPPSGSPITGAVGVVTVQDRPDVFTRPYAFVHTADGHLWTAWHDAVQFNWSDLGTPPGTTVAAAIGVVGVQDSPDRPRRPYIFVLGADGNAWLSWWDGARFRWYGLGTPYPGAFDYPTSRNQVGVTILRNTTNSPDYPQAFVFDWQRNLWRLGWHGSGWSWQNHGMPPSSLKPTTGNGAISIQSWPGEPSRPYAFVGVYGLLYSLSWTGTTWAWATTGGPGGVSLPPVGAIPVRESPVLGQRPYVFTTDQEGGPLNVTWPDYQGRWNSAKLSGTDVAPERSLGSATTVQDLPGMPERPYIFYWSNRGQVNPKPARLMLSWWG